MYRIYEVQTGDTFASVANRLGITQDVLATLNGINISTVLTPGTYIVVPSSETIFDRYIIKKGDTVYEIARKYNVEPSQLLKLNGLGLHDIIYPDQEILVPKAGTAFFVTSEGDTLNKIMQTLKVTADNIARQNDTLYLVPDQLVVYKK